MNKDDYGEVINGPETTENIVRELQNGKAVMIGWADRFGSHFDILMSTNNVVYGQVQGGVRATDLFVSIMRRGAFGFKIDERNLTEGYVATKTDVPSRELTQLINDVRLKLYELR